MQAIKNLNRGSTVTSFFNNNKPLPLVITDQSGELPLLQWAQTHRDDIIACQLAYGAVLCRGFNVKGYQDFEKFIELTSSKALLYSERSSPRDSVGGRIYTSTSLRADQTIFLHNEQSYNLNFARSINFYCQKASETGGETPLADTRRILQRIPDELKFKLMDKGYLYKRNFTCLFGLTWQEAYQSDDKATVSQYLLDNDIDYQWDSGEIELRTSQKRKVIAVHPMTGEQCWFNHCTFFNFFVLDSLVQESLLALCSLDDMPNHTCFGDGTPFYDYEIEQLKQAYLAEKVAFSWQDGDILLVDNMLCSHGRSAFTGDRNVLVGLSDVVSWQDVQLSHESVLEI